MRNEEHKYSTTPPLKKEKFDEIIVKNYYFTAPI